MATEKYNGALYMTTIDGNSGHDDLQSPNILRRDIMFQLLFWDYVCVADSQFLTNPYFSALILDGQDVSNQLKYVDMDGGRMCFCDLDILTQKGLLHCVSRENTTLESVRSGFVSRFQNPNRVLSKEKTDRLSNVIKKFDCFSLDQIADAFHGNLLKAFDQSGYFFNDKSELSNELKQMIDGEKVYFDLLEAKIRAAYNGRKITREKYRFLYNLIKSCYIPNVPNALGMHYLANSCFYPIWQNPSKNSGMPYDYLSSDRMMAQYCCMFDAQIADLMPMDAFVNILHRLRKEFPPDNLAVIRRLLFGKARFATDKARRNAWELYNSYIDKANQLAIGELTSIFNRRFSEQVENAAQNTSFSIKLIPTNATIGAAMEAVFGVLNCQAEALNIDRDDLMRAATDAYHIKPDMLLLTGGNFDISTFHQQPDLNIKQYYDKISGMLGGYQKDLIIPAKNMDVEVFYDN